mgnify:CR=1 FL=1
MQTGHFLKFPERYRVHLQGAASRGCRTVILNGYQIMIHNSSPYLSLFIGIRGCERAGHGIQQTFLSVDFTEIVA